MNTIIYSFLTFTFVKDSFLIGKEKKAITLKPIINNIAEKKVATTNTKVVSTANTKIIDQPRGNKFPWGQCTWYVATKRNIPWSGDAVSWFQSAINFGRSVGRTPKPGAIVVTTEGVYGHVGYVESVKGDIFTFSEMNFKGWGVVSTRTVKVSEIPLVGFIY